jgi:hypothetical protein
MDQPNLVFADCEYILDTKSCCMLLAAAVMALVILFPCTAALTLYAEPSLALLPFFLALLGLVCLFRCLWTSIRSTGSIDFPKLMLVHVFRVVLVVFCIGLVASAALLLYKIKDTDNPVLSWFGAVFPFCFDLIIIAVYLEVWSTRGCVSRVFGIHLEETVRFARTIQILAIGFSISTMLIARDLDVLKPVPWTVYLPLLIAVLILTVRDLFLMISASRDSKKLDCCSIVFPLRYQQAQILSELLFLAFLFVVTIRTSVSEQVVVDAFFWLTLSLFPVFMATFLICSSCTMCVSEDQFHYNCKH